MLFFELLSDLVKIEQILFIVKTGAAISEVKSPLSIRQKEKWITIGDNDGPAHMHIDSEQIKLAEFVREQKPEKISFSVRFFDSDGTRILAAFFTKMYDENKMLISERQKIYDALDQEYSSKI